MIVPPGAPGISPRWTSSAKSAVGTAAGAQSSVWFTVSHGILNEVYAPRLDAACIRDFGFIVTAKDYFTEEKRDADHTVVLIEDGVPAFRLVNTSRDTIVLLKRFYPIPIVKWSFRSYILKLWWVSYPITRFTR
jgi:glucoamylase